MIPSSLQHSLESLFIDRRGYYSDINKKGVNFIEKAVIRI